MLLPPCTKPKDINSNYDAKMNTVGYLEAKVLKI